MKRISPGIIIILVAAICFTTLYLTAATMYSNDLVRYVAKLKNKIPYKYNAPTESQISLLRQAVWHLMKRSANTIDLATAKSLAGRVGYRIRTFTHIDDHVYYILESKYPVQRPWGTYIFYLGDINTTDVQAVIEIPHPVSERNICNIGIKLFVALLAGTQNDQKTFAFLLSGSRRSKFDVAFNAENNAFQGIHEEIIGSTTDVIQLHCFKIYNYPQIVITSGSPVTPSYLDRYINKLELGNFDIGVYDGIQYTKLGSTENLQATYTNSIGGNFIGIFLNRIVAHSKTKKDKFIDLTEDAVSETTVSETTTPETTVS